MIGLKNQRQQKRGLVAIAVNSNWNIANFRVGLIRGLQEAGYEVVALAPNDGFEGTLRELGVRHVPVRMNSSAMSPIQDSKLWLDYFNALRALKPNAFLAFTPKPNAIGSLAAHALKVPVINNMTGMAFVERHGLARSLPLWLLKTAFRRSRIVFFQNSDDMALFTELRIASSAQSRLVPGSGINLKHFAPSPKSASNSHVTNFTLIARLLSEKGVLEFVEAARILRAQMPYVRFRLLGPVSVANRTALHLEDVEQWVGEGIIDYLGQAEDVRPFIRESDCVVLPSYREGLPRVLLEAAAMARPVVASDVPGCRAVVEDGLNGLLCEPRNTDSLAKAMARMAQFTPEQRQTLGEAGRLKVEAQFSEKIVLERYLAALAEVAHR